MSFPGGSDGKESACNVGVKVKVAQSCPTLCDPMDCYSPWNSPGQNTRVGSLSLLQGIFPTQRWNPGLPHHRRILYQLSHKGSPHPNLFRSIHMATDGMISGLEDMKPFLSSSKGLKQLVMFYSKIGLPRGDHAQGTF